MRVSTSTIFDVNVASMNQNQSKLLHTQQQVSAGRRILTPADDPVGATRALDLTQSDAAITQYAANINTTQNSLVLSESTLGNVTTLLQDIHTTTIQAGNTGALTNTDRKGMATALQGQLDQLISLANSTDGLGNYLFSGFQGKTPPFVNTATVQYMGDDGQRLNQVSANRQLASSDSGADIFMRIKNGNGTFVTQADPASNGGTGNTGSGVASLGNVTNPALLTGNNYRIDFAVIAGVTTYTVTNTTNGNPTVPPLAGIPYVSGQAISFDGMQFDIHGAPANGDQFTVAPSTNESIFKTISDLINTLNTPVIAGNSASITQLSTGVDRALNGLTRGLDNVLRIRASMGVRLQELDTIKATGDDLSMQYKQALSQLQDVDYNKAITDLTQQKTMLEAAQKSFLQIQNLSVFNYMP